MIRHNKLLKCVSIKRLVLSGGRYQHRGEFNNKDIGKKKLKQNVANSGGMFQSDDSF
jgi:hypothetical protein